MPRKGAKNDHVSLVRSRLPEFANLSREKIELALLYYDSDVDATVQAFERDGAIDALSGWTEMTHDRGNNGNKRTNGNATRKTSSTPSNGALRPSQRVSNLFQTFADSNGRTVAQASPSQEENPLFSTVRAETNGNSSAEISTPPENVPPTATAEKPPTTNDVEQSPTTVTKSFSSDNRKILTKSAKDLQRQTSTLSNVENSFENEMKASVKRIADVFKEIREILKDREVQLYLEMDKAKEQGLAVVRRRQERASELRQRMDQCDRLEAAEIDHLRTDVKQFVTDRRYDLSEELTSSHRFEYDPSVVEALKHFGSVLRLDRVRTASTSNATETNGIAADKPLEFAPTTSNSFVEHEEKVQQQNGHSAGDFQKNYSFTHTNGHHQHHYHDESRQFPMKNHRRRPAAPPLNGQNHFQYHNGGNQPRRARPPRTPTQQNSETPSSRSTRPPPPPPAPPLANERTVVE